VLHHLTRLDIVFFQLINAHHSPVADAAFGVLTQLGNGWVVVPLLALALILVYRNQRNELRRVLVICGVALCLSGLVDNGVKLAAGRARPLVHFSQGRAAGESDYQVHVLGPRLQANSMPSGHTNTAFAVATLCVIFLGVRYWPTYAVACLVGYSRVYVGVHFPLDTVVGAALGVAVAVAVVGASGYWRGARPAVAAVRARFGARQPVPRSQPSTVGKPV